MRVLVTTAITATASLLAAAVCLFPQNRLPGQEPKVAEHEESSLWMKKKLEFSQKVLAGLTEGDFAKIKRNAEAMNFLGYLEKWARAGEPAYKRQVVHFETALQELSLQAQARNLEGVTLAYNQLTISCVQCHRLVRDVKK